MIKVGLLVDSLKVPVWINELVESLQKDQRFTIELIIINDAIKPRKSLKDQFNTVGYRFLRTVDKKIMSVKNHPFIRVTLKNSTQNIIQVQPIRKRYSDWFSAESIAEIKKFEPDILLRFGFRILRGDILTTAKYGIISLHHGDTDLFRGGPPAFWEVVKKEPVTAVTLQKLTENLDGGLVLNKAFLKTDATSFYRNQVKLYWAGKELLLSTLQVIAEAGIESFFLNKQNASFQKIYTAPLYKNPDNIRSVFIFFSWLLQSVKRKCVDFFFPLRWQIIYGAANENGFEKSLFRYKTLTPAKNTEWADPFLIKKDEKYILFFEEKHFNKSEAHISFIELNSRGEVMNKKPVVALQEKYHLSYPYVFLYNEEYYMIPESASVNEVWLYKAVSFPAEWVKVKRLLENTKVYDSTLYFHNETWYLFGNSKSDNKLSSDAYLHIYYTNDLLNDSFQPHPLNPVYRDARHARPAGKITEKNGYITRPAQISAPCYGYGISIRHILKLSKTEFEEVEMDTIKPLWNKKINGIHTLNMDESFVVADVLVKRFRWS